MISKRAHTHIYFCVCMCARACVIVNMELELGIRWIFPCSTTDLFLSNPGGFVSNRANYCHWL